MIREVIDEARKNLPIVSYVFHKASQIVNSLDDAKNRGVCIRILLESLTDHGEAVMGDGIVAMH